MFFCLCLFIVINCPAQTVVELKSGYVVEGELLERDNEYIKVRVNDVALTYWMDEIENIAFEVKPQITIRGTFPDSEDAREIQKVWKNALTSFVNRDIDAIMKTISPNYSRSIDDTAINYDGFRTIVETNDAEFFSNHLSCSVDDVKILKSNIADNKAVVEFEYQLYAFAKDSMQWVTYRMIQEVTFAKENGDWKIITHGDKEVLF